MVKKQNDNGFKWQFSLKFLVGLIALSAVLLGIWTQRPSPTVVVSITDNDTAVVEENTLQIEHLTAKLDYERKRRAWWLAGCNLELRVAQTVDVGVIQECISNAQAVGINRFVFGNLDDAEKSISDSLPRQ